MILTVFTLVHVVLSLVGIGSGFVVLYGLLASRRDDRWTAVFLVTTLATSVTGFLFPFHGFTPADGVGILSMIVLPISMLALYRFRLVGGWRRIYAVTAVSALYLNVFVLIAQMFQKIQSLRALAPTRTEAPFQIAELIVLLLFTALGIRATIKFGNEPLRTA